MSKKRIILLIFVSFAVLRLSVFIGERFVRRRAAEAYFIGKYSGYTDTSDFEITHIPINRLKHIEAVCNGVVFQIRLRPRLRPYDLYDNFGERYIEIQYNKYINEIVADIKNIKTELIQVDYFDIAPTSDRLYSYDNKFILTVWLKESIETSYDAVKEQLYTELEASGLTGCSDIYIYESYKSNGE